MINFRTLVIVFQQIQLLHDILKNQNSPKLKGKRQMKLSNLLDSRYTPIYKYIPVSRILRISINKLVQLDMDIYLINANRDITYVYDVQLFTRNNKSGISSQICYRYFHYNKYPNPHQCQILLVILNLFLY
jgi:hypothetical protein